MKEIVYGTTNPAKVAQLSSVLKPLGFEVKSLADFSIQTIVEEDGETAEENARKKAISYAKAIGKSVLSMDDGLYFNDLPDEQQPGLHIRRIKGSELSSDAEILAYYADLTKSLGGRADVYLRYAFALSRPDGDCVSFSHDTPRIFVSTPSNTVIKGFPLASLGVDPLSGKYISEMSTDEMANFWQSTIGTPLAKFIQENY